MLSKWIKVPKSCLPVFIFLVSLLLIADPAYAYIDPGSGSILLQILVAIGASVLFLFGWLNTKIRSLLTFRRNRKVSTNNED